LKHVIVIAPVLFVLAAATGVYAQDLSAPLISEIRLEGLDSVNEQLVRSKMEVQVGQPYNPGAVARDVRRLQGLGHFDTVRVDAQTVAGGVGLVYVFAEKRIIGEVKIIGNRKLKDGKVRGALSWKQGDAFSPDAYDEERRAILKLYEEKGFANTSVDISVEDIGASRVRVTYSIHEGKKARIRSIEFEGNAALTDRQLKKAMKTKRGLWFMGGKFNEEKLEADFRSILDKYGDVGHLEADVASTDITYNPSGKKMDIVIGLNEGSQYTVASREVAGNVVYDDDEIEKIIEVHSGDVHNKSQVAADAELVTKGYQDSGYVDADVVPQVTLNRTDKTTHIVDRVREGELKYVKQVEIAGNATTKDEVIRREVMSSPGERFDGGAMELSERRLHNTQYFERVRLTLQDIDESDLFTNMLTDVEEGKTGNFNFGAGYSTEEKVSGFAELRLNNFDITNWPKFTGGGQVFSMRLQAGSVRNQYNVSFTDPEFLGYPIAFGFDVFNESYRYTEDSDYREDTSGGQIRLGKMLSPFVTLKTSFRYSDISYGDLGALWLYTREWRREFQDTTTISNSWSLERNTVDNNTNPGHGGKHELVGTLAGFGGDNNFIRLEHSSTWYWTLDENDKWVLSYRTREGWETEYGSSDYVPLAERFFAGGTTTVRGYETREIGPRARKYWFLRETEPVGGKARIINNLEMKYKVTDILRLYAFIDAGGVWEDAGDVDFDGIRYGAGLGFGVDVPKLGPIRIDYGIPLNPDDDQGNGRLHLMTGLRF